MADLIRPSWLEIAADREAWRPTETSFIKAASARWRQALDSYTGSPSPFLAPYFLARTRRSFAPHLSWRPFYAGALSVPIPALGFGTSVANKIMLEACTACVVREA